MTAKGPLTTQQAARVSIDRQLSDAAWADPDRQEPNLFATARVDSGGPHRSRAANRCPQARSGRMGFQ